MPEKNIYIRDEDMPIWGEAEKLAGSVGFSLLITDLLRDHVAREKAKQEARSKPAKTIEFDYKDEDGRMIKKSFQGRWVLDFKDLFNPLKGLPLPKGMPEEVAKECCVAAITAQGNIFFAFYSPDDGDYLMDFDIYDSIEKAEREGMDGAALNRVAAELGGDFVEMLDI
jgi:hypothetical protein